MRQPYDDGLHRLLEDIGPISRHCFSHSDWTRAYLRHVEDLVRASSACDSILAEVLARLKLHVRVRRAQPSPRIRCMDSCTPLGMGHLLEQLTSKPEREAPWVYTELTWEGPRLPR